MTLENQLRIVVVASSILSGCIAYVTAVILLSLVN